MSIIGHARRLNVLEAKIARDQRTVLVWRDGEETNEQALARAFPDGMPDRATPSVVGWMTPGICAAHPVSCWDTCSRL